MKKVATSLLVGLLAVIFIMSVYTVGTGKRYSPWGHFEKIVSGFGTLPSVEALTTIWTGNGGLDVAALEFAMRNYAVLTDAELEEMVARGEINLSDYAHYKTCHVEGKKACDEDPEGFFEMWKSMYMWNKFFSDGTSFGGIVGGVTGAEDPSMLLKPEYGAQAGCVDKDCPWFVDLSEYYTSEYEDTDEENEILKFFGSIKAFFLRLHDSVVWVCNYVVGLFRLIALLFPWNGLVPR